jgi:hypothetical protein
MIVVFVGFSRIFILGILIFKGLTARRLYKSFSVKGLTKLFVLCSHPHVRSDDSHVPDSAKKVFPIILR